MPTKMTKSHGSTKSTKLILRPHLTYEQHLTLVIISNFLNYVLCLVSGQNSLFILFLPLRPLFPPSFADLFLPSQLLIIGVLRTRSSTSFLTSLP